MSIRDVVLGVAYSDHSWGEQTVRIPAETPEGTTESVAREIFLRDWPGRPVLGCWLIYTGPPQDVYG